MTDLRVVADACITQAPVFKICIYVVFLSPLAYHLTCLLAMTPLSPNPSPDLTCSCLASSLPPL